VLGDVGWVADTEVISQNPKVTALNTCIEVDLTGQVCADSMGTFMYTGMQNIIHMCVFRVNINDADTAASLGNNVEKISCSCCITLRNVIASAKDVMFLSVCDLIMHRLVK